MRSENIREAKHFIPLDGKKVRCVLCPHNCTLEDGEKGICTSRENTGGKLFTNIYGVVSSAGIDPMEKKPLYHFLPGSPIFSIGTLGCNFKCIFCQNYVISQRLTNYADVVNPEDVVESAIKSGAVGIAYTYSEPLIWWEFVYDTSKLAHENNLVNVLVTNGFINQKPLIELLPFIDAMNIDLKAFNDDFYRKYTGGFLKPVLNTIKTSFNSGTHIEITHLVITELNDSEEEFKKLVNWVSELSPDIPFHISRYFPAYRYSAPPTSPETMRRFYEIARGKMKYVYLGNFPEKNDTICPRCGATLIERFGYRTRVVELDTSTGKCKKCGLEIKGVWHL